MAWNRERLLRLGTYLLDSFVSRAWCCPFVSPEDESALRYHEVIKHPMDLTTIENKLWSGDYDDSVSKLYEDLAQIMLNAFEFHPKRAIIHKEAVDMLWCFHSITYNLNSLNDVLVNVKLPHEEFEEVCTVSPNLKR
jgi:hypothetical protein